VKEGTGTLLDNTMAAWATTNGCFGAHGSNLLRLVIWLGLKHQGHLVQKDVPIANVWKMVANKFGLPLPDNFQGGWFMAE